MEEPGREWRSRRWQKFAVRFNPAGSVRQGFGHWRSGGRGGGAIPKNLRRLAFPGASVLAVPAALAVLFSILTPVPSPLDRFDVARLRRGDAAAWREFVGLAARPLRTLIRRTLAPAGREADAADVLQDVFVRLCRDEFAALRGFDPARGKLSSWLYAIALRTAIDHLRHHRAAAAPLEAAPPEKLQTDAAATPGAPTGPGAKLSLPPDLVSPQQELILRLGFEDGLNVDEIAAALRLQAQTVRSQRHKALTRLREFLQHRKFF